MILASAMVTASWGQLAVVSGGMSVFLLTVVKLGDRLWGRRRNGNGMDARVARLEEHAKHTKGELKDIKETVNQISAHLLRGGRGE